MSLDTHFWQAVRTGKITSEDIQAELDDINKAPKFTVVEELQILDLQEALSYVRARERAYEGKGEQRRLSSLSQEAVQEAVPATAHKNKPLC